jgi:membrane-associated phospholipid phosphatase
MIDIHAIFDGSACQTIRTSRSHGILDLNFKKMALSFPFAVLAVLVSYRFLDTRIALLARDLLKSDDLLQAITADIPDALSLLVIFGSAFLWGNYLLHKRRGISNRQTRFFLLAGSAVPLAYFLKWLFKLLFGRTNTRFWLAGHMSDGFHWFHGGENCSSFPSGHMAVFAAFFAAFWLLYPRYRSLSIGGLLLLAVALIVTDYHFLSDVIAGTYLGLAVTCITGIGLSKIGHETV